MADVILVALILAFTALCLAYIAWCDRIIGDAPVAPSVTADVDSEHTEAVSA